MATGVAALVVAFLLWVGTGLAKESFDGGLIVTLRARCVAGVFLAVTGYRSVRRPRHRDVVDRGR